VSAAGSEAGSAPRVSVVVPLLDEAETVGELLERIRGAMRLREPRYEIIVVDDGSTDGTAALLREQEAEDPRLRVFRFTRNFGQNAALACGLFASRGDVVVTLDGDLQNPPEEIAKLLEAIEKGVDVVSACRAQRYEPLPRWIGSRAINWVAGWLTGVPLRDVGGQFKAYRRPVVEALRACWAPGKPVFPTALWLGFPVAEIDVRHDPRREGASRYTLRSLLRIHVDLITAFSTLPLAAMGLVGAGFLALGVAGCIVSLLRDGPAGFAGAASLTASGVGAVLLASGVLGQYLGRVYRTVSERSPGYVVREGPRRDGRGAVDSAREPS
jgi:undecaprenyl-phosphate 4-deoxy-4-formamido-L-arabinose transferase